MASDLNIPADIAFAARLLHLCHGIFESKPALVLQQRLDRAGSVHSSSLNMRHFCQGVAQDLHAGIFGQDHQVGHT